MYSFVASGGHLLACFPHVHTYSFRRNCSRETCQECPSILSAPTSRPCHHWISLPTQSFTGSKHTRMRGCICNSSTTHVVHHSGDPLACPTSPCSPGHYYQSVHQVTSSKGSFLPLLVACVCEFSLNMFSLLYINYA